MEIIRKLEKAIVWALMFLLAIILVFAIFDMVYQIIKRIAEAPNYIPEFDLLITVFGMFLFILIGIELLETIKAYLKENMVHVEIVLLVGIIAIARKVIVMDYDQYPPVTLVGMAALVIALAGGYYLIKQIDCKYPLKRGRGTDQKEPAKPKDETPDK
jgi:uncharacterized membrane protein (DUF373 family)